MSKNQLSLEKSPYLKQHSNNPVWWHAWGEVAFEAARKQNKPIFLSIGYATCYWCHVMEKDSFETQEVANVLNDLFISIKVDREERPDVDAIYMDTVVALTGHGGWPLSVALTPDLKPYWAGTFFYKDQFIQVLQALARAWKEDREKVVESALEITQEIFKEKTKTENLELDSAPISKASARLSQGFDSTYGGFGPAPKFPPAFQLGMLLRFAKKSSDPKQIEAVQNMLTITLDNMISSGIYDQIGGGFHRYATDEKWLIPHFEKMLYDNAQLCHVLCEAYQVSRNENYLLAAKGSANYIIRDLKSPEGAFYAAQDAGEVGREGEYYVFKYQELKDALSAEEFDIASRLLGITEAGNFEHNNNIFALNPNITPAQVANDSELIKKLLSIRNKRTKPLIDTKILTSWNALMIRALVKLYEVSLEDSYLSAAKKAADFLISTLWDASSAKLYRRYAEGEAGIAGCLEDYAFLVEALLELFCISGDEVWFNKAIEIQASQDKLFWNEALGLYYDSTATELISKKIELNDGATPAGNSVAAKNLLTISRLTADLELADKAKTILLNFSDSFERYPHAACRALQALDLYLDIPSEIVLAEGKDEQVDIAMRWLSKQFLPNSIRVNLGGNKIINPKLQALLGAKDAIENTLIYMCSGHTCNKPLKVEELIDRS